MSAVQIAWLWVVTAGFLEVIWMVSLKRSAGFTKLGPSIFTVVVMGLSLVLVSRALKSIPIGTTYAVWTGIGAAGGAAIGILLYGESANPARIACIGLIVGGILGLKLLPTNH
jgi:quaternary ammonium compound-resistance protein SugE